MSVHQVLSTAAALREFTAAQVAAYCGEDEDVVAAVLGDHGEFVEAIPAGRWRIRDREGLKGALVASRREPAPAPRPDPGGSREARLHLAEQTLIACGREPSAVDRQVMAATAFNYLRQFVAGTGPAANREAWWTIGPGSVDAVIDQAVTGAGPVLPSRLRTDFALVRMTESEASDEKVGIGFLVDTATELTALPGSRGIDEERVGALCQRFAELAKKLTTPTAPDDPAAAAPARLLSALAWRRATPAVLGGCAPAARAQVTLLRRLAEYPAIRGGDRPRLYRVLGSPRRGRQRVAVYQDLLDLLPSTSTCEPVEELLPGAVVAAVTDADAAGLLRHYASVLEADLATSPYLSDRALVGQVVHRFGEFTVAGANGDRGTVTRTTETHRQLLTLFDVDV